MEKNKLYVKYFLFIYIFFISKIGFLNIIWKLKLGNTTFATGLSGETTVCCMSETVREDRMDAESIEKRK